MFRSVKFWLAFLIMTMLAVSCSKQETAQQNPVERGKYLVTLGAVMIAYAESPAEEHAR